MRTIQSPNNFWDQAPKQTTDLCADYNRRTPPASRGHSASRAGRGRKPSPFLFFLSYLFWFFVCAFFSFSARGSLQCRFTRVSAVAGKKPPWWSIWARPSPSKIVPFPPLPNRISPAFCDCAPVFSLALVFYLSVDFIPYCYALFLLPLRVAIVFRHHYHFVFSQVV